jgi:hypothetical protein
MSPPDVARQNIALVIARLAQAFPTRTVRIVANDRRQAVFSIETPDRSHRAFVIASRQLLDDVSDSILECLLRAISLLREGHHEVLLTESAVKPRRCLPD